MKIKRTQIKTEHKYIYRLEYQSSAKQVGIDDDGKLYEYTEISYLWRFQKNIVKYKQYRKNFKTLEEALEHRALFE